MSPENPTVMEFFFETDTQKVEGKVTITDGPATLPEMLVSVIKRCCEDVPSLHLAKTVKLTAKVITPRKAKGRRCRG